MAVQIISDTICKQNQNYLPCVSSIGGYVYLTYNIHNLTSRINKLAICYSATSIFCNYQENFFFCYDRVEWLFWWGGTWSGIKPITGFERYLAKTSHFARNDPESPPCRLCVGCGPCLKKPQSWPQPVLLPHRPHHRRRYFGYIGEQMTQVVWLPAPRPLF